MAHPEVVLNHGVVAFDFFKDKYRPSGRIWFLYFRGEMDV